MMDLTNMDEEEKELLKMLTSKFEGKELTKLLQLIAIDAKKYHEEQLLNSRLHAVVGQSEQLQPKQECYKSGELCKYNCSGLCKESC